MAKNSDDLDLYLKQYTDYDALMSGIASFIPNFNLEYISIFNALEDAFLNFFLSPEEVLHWLDALSKLPGQSGPDFFNLTFEELFDFPITEGGETPITFTHAFAEGSVTSVERELDFSAAIENPTSVERFITTIST